MIRTVVTTIAAVLYTWLAFGADVGMMASGLGSLPTLTDGETHMVNALWIENPPELKLGEGRSVVTVADLKGPGIITMIHFAMPETLKLTRDTVLRMWWDGEANPSVECPLVDFFCDPNGALERVDTALVNKKRGWNCYFPMPFTKSARIEISCDNPRYAATWQRNPCYSYVMYRTIKRAPKSQGYFHARWNQRTLLLGAEDYEVFEATGRGQFIGWNMTIRGAATPKAGYPVDENEKFYVDGERDPSIEWQGLEDSFGFSYGFPEKANGFAYTGWQPYYDVGAAAYRFCLNDRITFRKSLRMTVGFGKREDPMFRREYSKPENALQLSSVAYWYQREPHRPMPKLSSSQDRAPVFFQTWTSPDPAKYEAAHETVVLNCGKRDGDIEYLRSGWDFVLKQGYTFEGWATPVNHCWADYKRLEFEITCPKGATGVLKLYLIDGDNLAGGRRQSVTVAGKSLGVFENFQQGQWIEIPIAAQDTTEGRIPVSADNLKPGGNAVVSRIRFIASGQP